MVAGSVCHMTGDGCKQMPSASLQERDYNCTLHPEPPSISFKSLYLALHASLVTFKHLFERPVMYNTVLTLELVPAGVGWSLFRRPSLIEYS